MSQPGRRQGPEHKLVAVSVVWFVALGALAVLGDHLSPHDLADVVWVLGLGAFITTLVLIFVKW